MKTLLIALVGLSLAFRSVLAAEVDVWSEIRIADQPAGYQHLSRQASADGMLRTTDESVIVINRLGSRVEVRTRTETTETSAGEVVSVREESSSSEQTVVTEAQVGPEAISIATTSGENSYSSSVPNPEPIHGPAFLARLTAAGLTDPDDEVACRMFAPSLGLHTVRRTLISIDSRDGQRVYRVRTTIDGLPGDAEELLRADGTTISARRELPFGTMVASATTREAALRSAIGGELPAEAYERTIARANIRLPDPRSIDRLRLRITHRKPEYGWPAMRGRYQRVIEKSPEAIIVEVDANTGAHPWAYEKPTDADLGSNQILQADDAEIVRLTREVVAGEVDPEKVALRLQGWVARHMEFDAGVAITPASEVVRNRRGTCVAYSVLLASMARAAGLPARVAMGYVYVSGMWGGHAWAEVWIGGAWRAIDAAAYRAGYADAARFQIDSYDFADGGASGNYDGLRVYGNIDVFVTEYSADGENHAVGPRAEAHVVEGDVYTNTWLGVRVRKPGPMTFMNLDAIYPDPTVLRAKDEASSFHVALLQVGVDPDRSIQDKINEIGSAGEAVARDLAGHAAMSIVGTERARLLCRRGQSLWMITCEGPKAADLLESVTENWTWMKTSRSERE